MNRFLKKTLLALLVLVVLLLAAAKWGEGRVVRLAEKKIAELGILKYDSLHVSLMEGDVSLYGAAIDWKWVEEGKQLSLRSPEIHIEGIKWRKLFFDEKLKIKSLVVDAPDMSVREIPTDTAQSAPQTEASKDDPAIKVYSLELGRVDLEGGCFELLQPLRRKQGEIATATAGGVHISLTDLKFNLQADVVTAPTMKKADLRLDGIELDFPGRSHRIALDQFHLNKKDSLIEVIGLHVQPNDSPEALFKKAKYKRPWITLRLEKAVVHGWEFKKLVKQGRFLAHTVQLTGLDATVRTNQNLRPDPNSYKPMPQELLRNAGLPIIVDSVRVEDSRLRFENVGPGKTEFGTLTFDPLDITIANLTNDSTRIAQQKTMRVDAVASCQAKHRVKNTFWFDLASPNSAFSFKGSAAEFPFPSLNSFIKPCANIAFEGGVIHKLQFEANGNASTITGKLSMDYEGLDLALLDQAREKRRFLSKMVQVLFVGTDNDASGEDFNKGEILARRNTKLSFINFWWSAIQSGIKTSLLEDSTLERMDKFAEKRKAKKAKKARKKAH